MGIRFLCIDGGCIYEFDPTMCPTAALNDLIRVCIDMVFWNFIIRHGILEPYYCALFSSRWYFRVLKYIALHWYFLSIFLVFSDYGLSRSRRYFRVLTVLS